MVKYEEWQLLAHASMETRLRKPEYMHGHILRPVSISGWLPRRIFTKRQVDATQQ